MIMIEIKKSCNSYNLFEELWSGGLDTYKKIVEHHKTDELMQLLKEVFYEPTDITKINDFLWFDRDFIYEAVGMEEEI